MASAFIRKSLGDHTRYEYVLQLPIFRVQFRIHTFYDIDDILKDNLS